MTTGLQPYACHPELSRGRRFSEPNDRLRSVFQRDRDRIIHSTAFRRLKYKTQVFVYHEGDHYRTRLSHSLEVAQIARSLARALGLNEDLTEALALAHDLGHTPFGHAGERALDQVMESYGGFDHNAQSLRVLTYLEQRYAAFDGLNLSWETLEGTCKHNGPLGTDAHDLPAAIIEYNAVHDLWLDAYPSLEAQIVTLSDDIAYNAHDIDDGVRAGLFSLQEIGDLALLRGPLTQVRETYGNVPQGRLVHECLRRLITVMVEDVMDETMRRVGRLNPAESDDIRRASTAIAAFSSSVFPQFMELKLLLHRRMYHHPRVETIMQQAERVVADLFQVFMADPEKMEDDGALMIGGQPSGDIMRARRVADYIAGMTDRFALLSHARWFDDTPDLR